MKYNLIEIVMPLTTFQDTKEVWIKDLSDRNTFLPWLYPLKTICHGEGEVIPRHQKSINYTMTKHSKYDLSSILNYTYYLICIISFNHYKNAIII